uniref:Ral guanine nucleotide dissociation stimulator-like 1 n=1 Tax=Strigamia maritima TaxID=126957 RepID=T1JJE6_STRMM
MDNQDIVRERMKFYVELCDCRICSKDCGYVALENRSQWTDFGQPTWRYWGEEKVDGAVFNVYLKKVRYFNPSKSASSDSDDEISHLEWETVRVRVIKAGRLDKLVEALITETGELDSTYFNIFLATYRSFANTSQVLSLVLEKYKKVIDNQSQTKDPLRDQTRKSFKLALTIWLDTLPEDFRDPPKYALLHQVMDFVEKYMPDNELQLRARHRLDKFLKEDIFRETTFFDTKDETLSTTMFMNGDEEHQSFLDIPNVHFAEQLTYLDSELFKKVIPHHCLGSVWSRRDKNRRSETSTVAATVEQFNCVSFRVISTILMAPDMKPTARAKFISKWIDIAQELRMLKNFSSLKSIISGLQCNPIYRLKKVWLAVQREKAEIFEELARIFSEDNNQSTARELLMKEGTAKMAESVGVNDRHMQKRIQKQNSNSGSIIRGTVPYLGTFLTDLTMIDTAIPDTINDGLINFDKRRKEFEVLAQIKLLQSSANSYTFKCDPKFQRWFENLPILDDKESYELSYHIEPHGVTVLPKDKKNGKLLGHRKTDSIASTSSSSSSQFFDQISDISVPSSPNESSLLERKMSTSSSSSSLPSLDVSIASSTGSTQTSPYKTPEFYIIKVSLETPGQREINGIIMYKSIMLSNSDRTPAVIRNAMMKHCLEGNPDSYVLAQLLPDGEMVLPSYANVYYAINTAHDLNFVLRLKQEDDNGEGGKKTKPSKTKKKLLSVTI